MIVMMMPKQLRLSRALPVLAIAGVVACQPGDRQTEIEPGAIPAAPEMRPGTEAAPGGITAPGVVDTLPADTVVGQARRTPAIGPPDTARRPATGQ
jgi:hypothetical protein